MKKTFLFLLVGLAGCRQSTHTVSDTTTEADPSSTVISYDTVPEMRTTVRPGPVAEYSEPIRDELNDWKFAVAVYETRRRFHFITQMQGKEMRVTDSLAIPNFGIEPKVEIRKGKEPLSCIIGFLNKKGQFMEYIGVNFKNEQLHARMINHYAVSMYKTPAQAK